jgi:hypothetical protein
MKTEIDGLYDHLTEIGKTIAKKETVMPMCFGIKGREIIRFPLNYNSQAEKLAKMAVSKAIFKKEKVEAVICIMEAYMREVDMKETPLIEKSPEFYQVIKKNIKPTDVLLSTLYRKGETTRRFWDVDESDPKNRRIFNFREMKFPSKQEEGEMDFGDIFD